jgi:hypothetical protein
MPSRWMSHRARIVGVLLLVGGLAAWADAGGPFKNPLRQRTSVDHLAEKIDKLEKHIDEYGSIVAKRPDVWGESRLMMHRQEYERQMAAQLDAFELSTQASLRRQDQAFLASSLAIQAAIAGTADTNVDQTIEQSLEIQRAEGLAAGTDKGLALEPSIQLDQRSRYLQHLHQLRRINEGDDVANQPGYAIDLLRVPVSILPGGKTRVGYGAEITVTANPELGDELLPYAFKRWVLNDLVNQFSLSLTRALNDAKLRSDRGKFKAIVTFLNDRQVEWERDEWYTDPGSIFMCPEGPGGDGKESAGLSPMVQSLVRGFFGVDHDGSGDVSMITNYLKGDFRADTIKIILDAGVDRGKTSRFAFPLSQFSEVYGQGLLLHAAWEAFERLGEPRILEPTPVIHYSDIEGYLTEELQASYRMLDANPSLWTYCTPELATAIRDRRRTDVKSQRSMFFAAIGEGRNTTTAAYAWAILAHAALLNQRLLDDMRETAANRGCPCAATDWQPFHGPNPPPEARAIFNQYVHCRWPLHVFAIDPITQDQNVTDAFGMRREMQLALALSFAGGNLNAQKSISYMRQLELELETVALNRTAVGFSHGDSTFGWRFTPRVQTPDIEPNATVIVRDLLIGGPKKDQLTNDYQLEAGSRECLALVVRPAFIQQVTFDVRSNWFKLTNPKQTEMSMEATAELSKDIRTLETLASACVKDAHRYRDGEVYRMLRRVNQLSQELSIQTLRTDVPNESAEGGFAMFDAENSALSPQLYGWYGVPGIDTAKTTSLFLVGENFSVQGTRAIAGNQKIASEVAGKKSETDADSADSLGQNSPLELQSHRVMRLDIKAGAQTVTRTNLDGKPAKYVEIRVSTPYGVSQAVYVPVVPSASAAEGQTIRDAIKEHLQAHHLDRFDWKGATPGHLILTMKDGDVEAARFANDTRDRKLSVDCSGELDAKLVSKLAGQTAQLAVWLMVKSADAGKAPERIAVGPWKLILGDAGAFPYRDLEALVSQSLRALPNGFNPKEVEVQGFIRLPADSGIVTHKLQNALTWKIVQAKAAPTNTLSPAPAPTGDLLPPAAN